MGHTQGDINSLGRPRKMFLPKPNQTTRKKLPNIPTFILKCKLLWFYPFVNSVHKIRILSFDRYINVYILIFAFLNKCSFQKHLEVMLKIKNVFIVMNDIFLSHCLLKDWHLLTSLYLYVGLPHTIYCQ